MDDRIDQLASYLISRTDDTVSSDSDTKNKNDIHNRSIPLSDGIFLRVGYEFDNPSFGYSNNPSSYITAYRRIVDKIKHALSLHYGQKRKWQRQQGRRRIWFVWHSWGAPFASVDLKLLNFYPGDSYVDWIGVSIFQQIYEGDGEDSSSKVNEENNWTGAGTGSMKYVKDVLDFAKLKDKPTMIAESTPFGGIVNNNVEMMHGNGNQEVQYNSTGKDSDSWDRWYSRVINLITRYNISMWCYINCDWDSQPMWQGIGK